MRASETANYADGVLRVKEMAMESEGAPWGRGHGQDKGQRLVLRDPCSLRVKISANVKEYPNSIDKISAGVSTDNVFSGLYAYCGIAVHI